ncbi:CHRD domain-containing protein [Acetobacter aceti]|uniref:CHRD domain-containing protein n=1 Tax=Acetobacter aceti TaxID=435 RepID=A0A6S6PLV7_ACEAC|nr:CHRD domain-containing protein [Acetobacter aceti]BCI68828.1 CHRD domain-containing protein [Acetobacter aceti]
MTFKKTIRSAFLASAVFTASFSMASAAEMDGMFMGNFSPEHGTKSHPKGMVDATLDSKTHELTYSIQWSGLSGPVSVAHFHGPANFDQDAGVVAPIDGPYTSPLKGKVKLDDKQVEELEAGKIYVNLHTAAHPNGEARAQLIKN